MEPIIRPSLKELEERISEIQTLDLAISTIEDIKAKLNLLFTGYTLSSLSFNPGFFIYRGIKYDAKPILFSYLSYPPVHKAKMGRANRVGVPVFYCATEKNVPFFELNAKPGERLVISEWALQTDLLVNNVGYTEPVFVDLNSIRPVPNFHPNDMLNEEVLHQGDILVQNFLAKTFSQKISDDDFYLYNITNAIAEKHFSEGDTFEYAKFKGLMYPTIRMEANADNLALTQLAIDKDFLKFEKVEYVEVINLNDNIYTYKILDVAFKINAEEIQWKNLNSNWITDS